MRLYSTPSGLIPTRLFFSKTIPLTQPILYPACPMVIIFPLGNQRAKSADASGIGLDAASTVLMKAKNRGKFFDQYEDQDADNIPDRSRVAAIWQPFLQRTIRAR